MNEEMPKNWEQKPVSRVRKQKLLKIAEAIKKAVPKGYILINFRVEEVDIE